MRPTKWAGGVALAVAAMAMAQHPPANTPATPSKNNLEELVTRAMQHSPDVQVAEAKLREAEVLLRQVRMQTAQRIVELMKTAEQQRALLANAETAFQLFAKVPGSSSKVEVMAAENKLLDAKGQLAKVENSINALTGKLPALEIAMGVPIRGNLTIESPNAGSGAGTGNEPKMRAPAPAMADRMRKALDTSIKMPDKGFQNVPLQDVFEFVRAAAPGVPFLFNLGDKAEESVRLNFRGDVNLAGMFQMLLDTVPDLRIQVRDYGFLVTFTGNDPYDGMNVLDFFATKTAK